MDDQDDDFLTEVNKGTRFERKVSEIELEQIVDMLEKAAFKKVPFENV